MGEFTADDRAKDPGPFQLCKVL